MDCIRNKTPFERQVILSRIILILMLTPLPSLTRSLLHSGGIYMRPTRQPHQVRIARPLSPAAFSLLSCSRVS